MQWDIKFIGLPIDVAAQSLLATTTNTGAARQHTHERDSFSQAREFKYHSERIVLHRAPECGSEPRNGLFHWSPRSLVKAISLIFPLILLPWQAVHSNSWEDMLDNANLRLAMVQEKSSARMPIEIHQAIREEIADRLERDGSVELWVRLDVKFEPEGFMEKVNRESLIEDQRRGILKEQLDMLDHLGTTVLNYRSYDGFIPWLFVELNQEGITALKQYPRSKDILLPVVLEPLLSETAPLVGARAPSEQANLEEYGPHEYGFTGSAYTVAVLDTGIYHAHEAFSQLSKLRDEACFSSNRSIYPTRQSLCANGEDQQIGPQSAPEGEGETCDTNVDGCGHGTHVSSIALGRISSTGYQYDGVAQGARVMPIGVAHKRNACGDDPSPCVRIHDSDLADGLWHAYNNRFGDEPLVAVNLSLGRGPLFSDGYTGFCSGVNSHIEDAISQLVAAGIAVVASTGNNAEDDRTKFPACLNSTIGVGGTWSDDSVWRHSGGGTNVSEALDLYAPASVWAADIVDNYASVPEIPPYVAGKAGTSMAAPHVSGAIAMLKLIAPDVENPFWFMGLLQNTGVPVNFAGIERWRIDIRAAMRELASVVHPQELPSDAGQHEVHVHTLTSTVNWKAISDTSWITLTTDAGAGSGDLVFSVTENQSGSTRTGEIYVLGNKIEVSQAASDPSPGDPPSVTTRTAVDVTDTSARLRGRVNPNGNSTNAWFEWGTSTSYGNNTPSQNLGSGNSNVDYDTEITGLSCGTTYYFRARAENSEGPANGQQEEFETESCPSPPGAPEIEIHSLELSSGGISVQTNVYPNNSFVNVRYHWGLSEGHYPNHFDYWDNPIDPDDVYDFGFFPADDWLEEVDCGTTYYFRPSATNTDGQTGYADPESITTGPCPCDYSISPTSGNADAEGGQGTVEVTAGSGCDWSANSNENWIQIESGGSGQGSGIVEYSVDANPNTSSRSGTIEIADLDFTVEQEGQTETRILSLSGNLDFGDVQVGSSADRTLNISNEGNSTLSVSEISYPSDVYSGDWDGGDIAAGDSREVTITFAPDSAQSYSGNVTVESNKTSGDDEHPISGTGVETPTYSLTLDKSGSGSGTVISDPAGIHCGPSCDSDTGEFPEDEAVTLTASPVSGSFFLGWSGDVDGGCESIQPCTVTMTQARDVTATFVLADGFDLPAYSTTGWDAPGYITLDPTDPETVLVINPDQPNHVFAATFIGNDFDTQLGLATSGGDLPQDMMIAIDTETGAFQELGLVSNSPGNNWTSMKWDYATETLYAVSVDELYTIDPDTLNASLVGPIEGDGLNPDPIIISMAISADGQMYGIDIVDDVFLAIDKNTGEAVVIGPLGVSPNFAQDMDFDHQDGTLYWAGQFSAGDSQILTIDIETGSATSIGDVHNGTQLLSFSLAVPAEPSYTLDVESTGATNVPIFGSLPKYDGTTNYSITGISPDTSISFTASATSGDAEFSSWSGCDSVFGTDGRTCMVTMDQNRTITANYSTSCNYSINPTNTSVGSDGGSGTVNVSSGAECSWTASSNVGWITVTSGGSGTGNGSFNYSVSSNSLSSSRSGTITVMDQNFIVEQSGLDEYTLTLEKSGSGSGTVTSDPPGISCAPSCNTNTGTFSEGTTVTLTASEESDSIFLGWFGPCLGTDECEFTIDQDLTVIAVFDLEVDSDDRVFHSRFEDALAAGGVVEGVSFAGTVSGITGNGDWASDMRLDLVSPDDQGFAVGGFGTDAADVDWDFQGSDSNDDGTYSSQHSNAYPGGAQLDGTWTVTLDHTWSGGVTMSWSEVSIALQGSDGTELGWLCIDHVDVAPDSPETLELQPTECDFQGVNILHNISMSPTSPAELEVGSQVIVDFDYEVSHAEGFRVWATAFSQGDFVASQPSPLESPGEGSLQRAFSVNQVIEVDQIRVRATNPDQTETFHEELIPVEYIFGIAEGENIIEDSDFEAGTPNDYWEEYSTNFGSPLCSLDTCPDWFGPYSGSWWGWFGGHGGKIESGSLSQEVVIPQGSSGQLQFWLAVPTTEGTGHLRVNLGGQEILFVDESDGPDYAAYQLVTIDVDAFANGTPQTLEFDSVTHGDGTVNFFVDQVSLTVSQ